MRSINLFANINFTIESRGGARLANDDWALLFTPDEPELIARLDLWFSRTPDRLPFFSSRMIFQIFEKRLFSTRENFRGRLPSLN